MTSITYNERASRIAAPSHETLLQILFRPFRRARVVHELQRLDQRMLSDIGISPTEIAHIAACSVEGKGEWIAVSLVKYAFRKIQLWLRRQETYRALSALDDRMLADIGVERSEIAALVKFIDSDDRAESVDGSFETEVVQPLKQWSLWRVAHKQLSRLDNRTLSDIGMVRGDIDWVADELASRAVAKPANANSIAPKAA